jgi:hypothetical protein
MLLDFGNVEFLSSAALNKLIILDKKVKQFKGRLKLCNLRPEIQEVFVITRLNQLFEIKDTVENALASFRPCSESGRHGQEGQEKTRCDPSTSPDAAEASVRREEAAGRTGRSSAIGARDRQARSRSRDAQRVLSKPDARGAVLFAGAEDDRNLGFPALADHGQYDLLAGPFAFDHREQVVGRPDRYAPSMATIKSA